MSKLQKKPSALKRDHPTLQNMNFYKFLSTFVGNFCPPGSGSTGPIESGSGSETLPLEQLCSCGFIYKNVCPILYKCRLAFGRFQEFLLFLLQGLCGELTLVVADHTSSTQGELTVRTGQKFCSV